MQRSPVLEQLLPDLHARLSLLLALHCDAHNVCTSICTLLHLQQQQQAQNTHPSSSNRQQQQQDVKSALLGSGSQEDNHSCYGNAMSCQLTAVGVQEENSSCYCDEKGYRLLLQVDVHRPSRQL